MGETPTEAPGLTRLWTDVKNATVACIIGLAVFALVDFVATLISAPGGVRVLAIIQLVFLELTLALTLMLIAWPLTVALACGSRILLWAALGSDYSNSSGLLGPAKPKSGPQSLPPYLWGVTLAGMGYLALSTILTLKLGSMFKEPQLTALSLAFAQLSLVAFLAIDALIIATVARILQRKCTRLGSFNIFGSTPAAIIALIVIAWPIVNLTLKRMPQLAPLIPWRHLLSFGAFVLGAHLATHLLARRGTLLPPTGRKRLIAIGVSAALVVVLVPLTLLKFGADQDTKALAISSSPTMSRTMDLIRVASDLDGDGFGSLLGENDCGPLNPNVHPLARDIPDNGIDENCDGRDFALGKLASYKTGERMPVPEAYLDDWNVLLLTIDTVRYDHTGFGGYKRDTTPNLDRFIKRAANFTFANAPSAGTMASVPSILASRFFHSGIALNEDVPRGSPPKLKPENTLIHEVLKKAGYRTGAILTHEYFNDWGMDQGVDEYDNSIGKKRDPYGVTSVKLTDRGIAWMGKQRPNKKWFLWMHYLDPHGRYVSHPGETSYGESEMDLYDGELHFTDKHLGRLLNYVSHSAHGKKTIIMITSDHGDAFGEHGYINHAQDLHRELLHVPLIIYVPNIEPRSIPGAVSPIDLFPTIADLVGADISHLEIEGESLVPQLFYGKDAHHRVVFSETNYPKPLRAAVTTRYKLILDLKANVSRLWNLKKDPWEKKNIWTTDKKGYKEMRGYLNEWIERVYYSRDSVSNQAIAKLQDHFVRERPTTAKPVEGVSADEGHIIVDSIEVPDKKHKPGDKVVVTVYFRVLEETKIGLKMQIEAWTDDKKAPTAKSRLRLTGGGLFSSTRWHKGELVRDRFKITLPPAWKSQLSTKELSLGIRFREKDRSKGKLTTAGTLREGTTDLYRVGSLAFEAAPAPTKPAPTKPKTP